MYKHTRSPKYKHTLPVQRNLIEKRQDRTFHNGVGG